MPYCTNCGTPVDPVAAYCGNCGFAQRPAAASGTRAQAAGLGGPGPQSTPFATPFFDSIDDRTACILCYIPVLGIVPSIFVLAAKRFRANYRVRFNAFQGLYLFVAWLIVSSALPSLLVGSWDRGFEHLLIAFLRLGLIFCWIYMLVQASQRNDVHLPIIGDLAARSTHEQL